MDCRHRTLHSHLSIMKETHPFRCGLSAKRSLSSNIYRNTAYAVIGALFLGHLQARGAQARTDSDRIVVMISVDGLPAYYLDDPKAEMPTIRALAAEGARASMMKASTPTVTWPNHTTLVTGVTPAKHGVLGNNYFDRETRKKVTLI